MPDGSPAEPLTPLPPLCRRWVRADIIAGAAILFIYMLLCAFHRQLLAPPKAALPV